MPLPRLLLTLADRADRRVLLAAGGALGLVVDLVEAALVERVLAEEVHGGQVESAAAGGAALRLEDDGLGGELVEFFALGGGFGAVVFDEAAVLCKGNLVGTPLVDWVRE